MYAVIMFNCVGLYILRLNSAIVRLWVSSARLRSGVGLYDSMEQLRQVIASQEIRPLYMEIFTGKLYPKINISFKAI